MSIARLRQVAAQKLPIDVRDEDEIDELRVLMAAGLIAGLQLRHCKDPGDPPTPIVRVLAITPDGRRLLRRSSAQPSLSSAGPP